MQFPVSAVTRRVPGPVVLLAGLTWGLAWGVLARLWMRFISTDPEFTWSGTLFIVIGFGIAGLAQSGAYLGRRAGLRRPAMTGVRVVGVIGLLPLGMAAGGTMFPTVILATLSLTNRGWPRGLRVLVGVIAVIPALLTAASLFDQLSLWRAVTGSIWFVAIYAGIIWAARFSLGPQLDGWYPPDLVRVAGGGVLMLMVLFASLMATGI